MEMLQVRTNAREWIIKHKVRPTLLDQLLGTKERYEDYPLLGHPFTFEQAAKHLLALEDQHPGVEFRAHKLAHGEHYFGHDNVPYVHYDPTKAPAKSDELTPEKYALLRARIALHLEPPNVELAKRYLDDVALVDDELVEVEGMLAKAKVRIRAGEVMYQAARERMQGIERSHAH